jgi:serine/threonine protein kinase
MTHDSAQLPEIDSIAALLPAFDFVGLIARGTAGTVYKARQRSLDRDVAIRILPSEKAHDAVFRRSFEARAKSMANLAHPGLIRVYDSGEVDGLPFMVMEYVPGKSLRHSARGTAIDPRQAVQIVIAACHGLAHAHGQGIAHGAIRPANILLTPKREPKLGNFGLAQPDPGDGGVDEAAAYRAPELAASNSSGNPSTDVYAIGVLLQELLTGIPAGTLDAAGSALADAKLAAICRQAAHSDPARRYSDAGALAAALEQWAAPRTTPRAPLPARFQRQTSPHRPKSPAVSKAPAVTYPGSRAGRGMLVHGAIIAALLLAIHGVWGAYRAKQDSVARLRQMEAEKPSVIVIHAMPLQESSEIDSSLVQFKP